MQEPQSQLLVTVSLSGELDLLTSSALRDELLDLASAAQGDEIVVDLAGVTFMDVTGLKPLIAAQNLLNRRGRSLRLCDVPRPIGRLIRVAGLAGALKVLEVAPTNANVESAPLIPAQHQASSITDAPSQSAIVSGV